MSSTTELIKSRLNIVDVVGGYLKLQRAGVNFKANCPFHSEKTPSFVVSPSRESWHCFGCNKGGDAFNFVMEIEGVDFVDALKILAQKAGVELKPMDKEHDSERSNLLRVLNDAKIFYQNGLAKNPEAIAYLKNRGLLTETLKEFEVGYVSDQWRDLYNFLVSRKYPLAMVEASGMIIKKQSDDKPSQVSYYDRFRNRIMFPVKNSAGQTIGFSGRVFDLGAKLPSGSLAPKSEPAKYINNPQTAIYDKSRVLFGLDKAKTEIRKQDLCILVEGQMDVIMSHQAGVKNAVAVSGTALTQEHLGIIKRLTENIAIAFDKDEAGLRASRRGIDMALTEGFDVKVILIPSGKDPADTIKENPETWREAVKNSKHIINFYLESVSDPNKIKETILPYVKLIPDEIKKSSWVKKISERYGVKEDAIWQELDKLKIEPYATEENHASESSVADSKNRLKFLKDCLTGFIYWQKDTKDQKLKEEIEKYRSRCAPIMEEKDAGKQIFEAERYYANSESLHEEFKKLTREMEKEDLKRQLEEITNNIYRLELLERGREERERDKKFDELLNNFRDLTKKLNELK